MLEHVANDDDGDRAGGQCAQANRAGACCAGSGSSAAARSKSPQVGANCSACAAACDGACGNPGARTGAYAKRASDASTGKPACPDAEH